MARTEGSKMECESKAELRAEITRLREENNMLSTQIRNLEPMVLNPNGLIEDVLIKIVDNEDEKLEGVFKSESSSYMSPDSLIKLIDCLCESGLDEWRNVEVTFSIKHY